jgi:hypothetical protein
MQEQTTDNVWLFFFAVMYVPSVSRIGVMVGFV